jgi:hypothetical protein
MVLNPCALITTDECNILCTYACTCILCSVAMFIECIQYIEKILFMAYIYITRSFMS